MRLVRPLGLFSFHQIKPIRVDSDHHTKSPSLRQNARCFLLHCPIVPDLSLKLPVIFHPYDSNSFEKVFLRCRSCLSFRGDSIDIAAGHRSEMPVNSLINRDVGDGLGLDCLIRGLRQVRHRLPPPPRILLLVYVCTFSGLLALTLPTQVQLAGTLVAWLCPIGWDFSCEARWLLPRCSVNGVVLRAIVLYSQRRGKARRIPA
jgi:hypothetical protein